MRGAGAVVACLVAATMLVGCSAPSPAPPAASDAPAPLMVPSVPAANALIADGDPAPIAWTVALGGDPSFPSYGPVTGDRIVARANAGDGRQVVTQYRRDGTSRFFGEPGEMAQDVFEVGDTLVFELGSDATGDSRVVAWNPRTDQTSELLAREDAWPEVVARGAVLYLIDTTRAGAMCVRAMDITDPMNPGETRELYCGDGTYLGWLVDTGEVISFVERPIDSQCGDVVMIDPATEAVSRVDLADCALHAVGSPVGVAWTPPLADTAERSYFHVPLSVTTAEGTVKLGDATAGSATWCGEWLYWQFDGDASTDAPAEIRRWTPGGDIEAVYRSPDGDVPDGYLTSKPTCSSDGSLSFQRIGVVTSETDLLVFPGLDWTPSLSSG